MISNEKILSKIGAGYQITAKETSVGVVPVDYAYLPYDIRRYGGDPTGVTPCDTALASALAVCSGTGGVIRMPVGTYLFNNQIVINNRSGIILQGDGCETIEAGAVTVLKYAGTGSGNWITISACFGCGLKGVQLNNGSASFTGSMLAAPTCNFTTLNDVTFLANGACTHLNLDQTVNFYATQVAFLNGSTSILGQNPNGSSFSNVVIFTRCFWSSQSATPVIYGGNQWIFRDCTWEPLANGKAAAFSSEVATAFQYGIVFDGCSFEDVTSPGGVWILCIGEGFNFHGNYIAGEATNTTAITLQCAGIDIRGNFFNVLTNAISFEAGPCSGLAIQGNNFSSIANQLVLAGNAPVDSVINPNSPTIPNYGYFLNPLGSTGTATTVGAAGSASVLPTAPIGYIVLTVNGTSVKVPYYNI